MGQNHRVGLGEQLHQRFRGRLNAGKPASQKKPQGQPDREGGQKPDIGPHQAYPGVRGQFSTGVKVTQGGHHP